MKNWKWITRTLQKKLIMAAVAVTLFSVALLTNLNAQSKLPPEVQAIQSELIKNYEDTAYGDYEIDLLHKKIAFLIPKVRELIETDSNGEQRIKIDVFTGESYKLTGEHYIVNGVAYLYPADKAGLKRVTISFTRQTATGVYKMEKRELTNPTPASAETNKIDGNNDITISYYETDDPNKDMTKVKEVVFSDILRHDFKMKLLGAYKNFLRKTLYALERRITSIELDKGHDLLFMLDLD